MAVQRLARWPQLNQLSASLARRSTTAPLSLRPLPQPQAQRSLHTTSLLRSGKPIRDVGTGVDPGYSHPTPEEENRQTPDVPRPSHLSDPFPLPFDPRLEGLSLSSSSQNESLAGAPSWEGGPPEITDAEAKEGYETPVPIRVPGRGPDDEDRATRIARLVYQARKRGTLETDLLLSTFAKTYLKELSDKELLEFDLLLDEPDWDIYYWLTVRKPVPERWRASFETEGRLGWRLRKHTRNEDGVLRTMPPLAQ